MKLIKIKFSLLILGVILTVCSCSDQFIEADGSGALLESTYYKNESDAKEALVAVYDKIGVYANTGDQGLWGAQLVFLSAGSDDNYGGGGHSADIAEVQAFSNYTINPQVITPHLWSDPYQ